MCDKDKNGILIMGAVRYTASEYHGSKLIIKTSEPPAFEEYLAGTED